MFCPNCGSKVKENSNFCHNCREDLRFFERDKYDKESYYSSNINEHSKPIYKTNKDSNSSSKSLNNLTESIS